MYLAVSDRHHADAFVTDQQWKDRPARVQQAAVVRKERAALRMRGRGSGRGIGRTPVAGGGGYRAAVVERDLGVRLAHGQASRRRDQDEVLVPHEPYAAPRHLDSELVRRERLGESGSDLVGGRRGQELRRDPLQAHEIASVAFGLFAAPLVRIRRPLPVPGRLPIALR